MYLASSNKEIRSFCAFMMKKQLSSFSGQKGCSAWTKISGQTATLIKDEIFIALRDESTSSVRTQICNLIGELGATIFNFMLTAISFKVDSNKLTK